MFKHQPATANLPKTTIASLSHLKIHQQTKSPFIITQFFKKNHLYT